TGILVKDGNRFFVLTAAHLSQGQGLTIRSANGTVLIKDHGRARFANNSFDVEWIEIENPHVQIFASVARPCSSNIGLLFLYAVAKGGPACLGANPAVIGAWNNQQILQASSPERDLFFTLIPSWTSTNGEGPAAFITHYNLLSIPDGYAANASEANT